MIGICKKKNTREFEQVFIMIGVQKVENIDSVIQGLRSNNLAQLFDVIGEEVKQKTSLNNRTVRAMNKRISTQSFCALGGGIAVPNVKVRGLKKPFSLLCVMDRAVECDTPDGRPVDIICVVLSPTDHGPLHLQRLSRFSRLLKNENLCTRIRDAKDADVIRALFASPEDLLIAA